MLCSVLLLDTNRNVCCYYAECLMQNVVTLTIVMLSIDMQGVIMFCVIPSNDITLCVVIQSVISHNMS